MMTQRTGNRLHTRTNGIPDTIWSVCFFLLMLSVICFGGTKEYIFYMIFFFMFAGYSLLLFLFRQRKGLRLYLPMQTMWYGLFIILSLLSGLWADWLPSVLYPMSRMIQILVMTYCLVIYLDSGEKLERYISTVLAASLFTIVFIFIRTPRAQWFAGFLGRVTYYNTNDVGCALSVCVLFAFYEAYVRKRKIFYALVVLAFFTAILTSSRKALLMCISGILMIVAFNYRARNYVLRVLITIAGLTAAVILIYQIPYLYGTVGVRLDKMIDFVMNDKVSDTSLMLRKFNIDMAKMFFKENPILGIGLHNFAYRIRDYRNISAYAHNNYMEIAADLGITGLIMYYWFYLYLIWKLAKQVLNGYKNALLFLPMMLLFLVFEYGMVTYYKIQVHLGISAAFAVVSLNDVDEKMKRHEDAA